MCVEEGRVGGYFRTVSGRMSKDGDSQNQKHMAKKWGLLTMHQARMDRQNIMMSLALCH